ncbi:MAG: response regulator [Candidatus Syntrophosphaera sp.]
MTGKVLIVDEDPLNRQTIGAWLERNGFEAGFAADADDAALRAETGTYDFVIVDIQWPDRLGTRVIERMRELFPCARVIAMSTFADFELEQEVRLKGAFTCMTKPLDEEGLLAVLDSAAPQEDEEKPEPEAAGDAGEEEEQGQESEQGEESGGKKEGYLPGRQLGQMLLRGFTPEQQWEFRMSGLLRTFAKGDVIEFGEDVAMVWVEKGRLEARYGRTPLDTLEEGDFWGEETFIDPNAAFTTLMALEDAHARIFQRKKVLDFFAYQDESLTKRYMINLIHCLHHKWKKCAAGLALAGEKYQQREE